MLPVLDNGGWVIRVRNRAVQNSDEKWYNGVKAWGLLCWAVVKRYRVLSAKQRSNSTSSSKQRSKELQRGVLVGTASSCPGSSVVIVPAARPATAVRLGKSLQAQRVYWAQSGGSLLQGAVCFP